MIQSTTDQPPEPPEGRYFPLGHGRAPHPGGGVSLEARPQGGGGGVPGRPDQPLRFGRRAALKRDLAQWIGADRDAYTEGKSEFIERVLADETVGEG